MRHGFLFGILEVGQGFEQVSSIVRNGGILGAEPFQDIVQAVGLRREIQIHEITPAASIRDCVELHTCDIARVGNGKDLELRQRDWLRSRTTSNVKLIRLLTLELHQGEAEAIALALETQPGRV